jgi:hypothetical protein
LNELGNLGIDGRIMLKLILEKTVAGCEWAYLAQERLYQFHKMWGISPPLWYFSVLEASCIADVRSLQSVPICLVVPVSFRKKVTVSFRKKIIHEIQYTSSCMRMVRITCLKIRAKLSGVSAQICIIILIKKKMPKTQKNIYVGYGHKTFSSTTYVHVVTLIHICVA